jgi:hypothetical protein
MFSPNKISNVELQVKTNTDDMRTLLTKRRWRWIGHVLRKPANNITKVALRWTPEGKRKPGRPKNTWRRTVEKEMKDQKITRGELERNAQDREKWRRLVLALCGPGHSMD